MFERAKSRHSHDVVREPGFVTIGPSLRVTGWIHFSHVQVRLNASESNAGVRPTILGLFRACRAWRNASEPRFDRPNLLNPTARDPPNDDWGIRRCGESTVQAG